MAGNGLCKWSAGLKAMNFQARTEPIRLFNSSNFPSIVKDELAVLQRRTAVELPAETRITFTFCYRKFFCITPIGGNLFNLYTLKIIVKFFLKNSIFKSLPSFNNFSIWVNKNKCWQCLSTILGINSCVRSFPIR